MFLKKNNKLIGLCGIDFKSNAGIKEYELAYFIAKSYQGKGYGKESCMAIINYSFSQLDIPAIVAIIDNKNKKSMNLAERIGMHQTDKLIKNNHEYFKYQIYNK